MTMRYGFYVGFMFCICAEISILLFGQVEVVRGYGVRGSEASWSSGHGFIETVFSISLK
jgi:hypothetical protein